MEQVLNIRASVVTAPAPAALLALHVLADAEPLSRGVPQACLPPGVDVAESLLPEVRQLAILLAARRQVPCARTPDRLTDAADWLAARIVLFELASLALPAAELPLLAEANARIRALGQALGLSLPTAQLAPLSDARGALLVYSRLPLLPDALSRPLIERCALLRSLVRLRAQPLFARLGL